MKPQLQKAVAMVQQGKTYAQAAAACGVSRNAVAGACYRAGYKTGTRALLTDHQIARRLAIIDSCNTQYEAAQRLGISRTAVSRTLSKYGSRTA